EFPPVGSIRGGDGCAHELEITRAVRVGEDDEVVAVVLQRVLFVLLAPGDQRGRLPWPGCIDVAHFAGRVIMRADEDEALALGGADGDEKARIGFLVYQLRRSLRCAELQP